MADYYWIGGGAGARSGTWNTTSLTVWATTSGGTTNPSVVPTASDNVIFDQADTYTVTMTGALLCANITVSAGTVTFATGTTPTLAVSGSMSIIAGTVWNSTGTITFNATTAKTISTNEITIDAPITFNGTGGSWQLQSNFKAGSTRTTTLTAGTLDLQSYTFTSGLFSSSGAVARTIAFGTGNITVNGTGSVWNTTTVTSLTITGTPVVNVSNNTATAATVIPGALTEANSISFNFTTGTYSLTFLGTASNTARNVNFTGFAGTWAAISTGIIYGNLTVSSTMTITASTSALTFAATSGTKTITSNGKTLDFPVTFNGVGGTWQLQDNLTIGSTRTTTLTNGTIDLQSYTFTTGLFSSTVTTARTIAFGTGNITVNGNSLTSLDIGNATNLSLTGTPIFQLTNSTAIGVYLGTTAGYFTEANTLSVFAGSSTGAAGVYVSNTTTLSLNGNFKNINLTGFTGALANSARTIYGNLTIPATGVTITAGASLTTFIVTSATKTIDTNGVTLDFPITFNSSTGIWQLLSAMTIGITRLMTLTAGTIDLNNFTLSTGLFNSSVATARTIAFGTTGILAATGNSATAIDISNGTNLTITGTPIFQLTNATASGSSIGTTAGYFTETTSISVYAGAVVAGTEGIYISNTTTLTLAGLFKNFDLSGFTGTLANSTRTIYGKFTVTSGVTLTGGTNVTTFITTSGSKKITTNGKTLDFPVTFNGVGGSWQLLDNATIGSTRITTLTAGTIDLNNFILSTGFFSSSGSTARSVGFSTSGQLALSGSGSTIFDISTSTNLTITGTLYINCTYTGATGTRTIALGSLTEVQAANFSVSTSGTTGIILSTTATDTITLNGNYNNIDLTGFSGILSNTAKTIYGGLTISATGGTYTAGTNAFTFAATSGTKSIGTNGRTIDFPIIFNGIGGTWQLQSAFTIGSTRTTTLTNGTIDLNNQIFSTGLFSSSGSTARTVAFGTSGQLALSGSGVTILDTSTPTNLTITGTSYINCTYTGSTGTRTISTGALTESQAANFGVAASGTSGIVLSPSATDTITLNGSYGTIDLTSFTGTLSNTARTVYGNLIIPATGGTYTAGTSATTFAATSGTKTLNTNSRTLDFPVTFNGVGGTWQLQSAFSIGSTRTAILTAGTLDLQSYTFTSGLFNSSGSTARTIAFSTGNITVNGTGTIWETTTITNLTTTGTRVVNISNGTATATTVNPGTLTEANSISFNITTGTYALTFLGTASHTVRNVDFTGFSGTWAAVSTGIIYGNLILSSTMTITSSTNAITFAATSGTKTITSNGKTLDFPLTFNGIGGTWQLQDNLTIGSTRTTTLTNGTIDLNNQIFSTGLFSSSGSTARTIDFGTSGQLAIVGNNATILTLTTTTNLSILGTLYINCSYAGSTGTRTISTGFTEAQSSSYPIFASGATGIVLSSTATDTVALTGNFGDIDLTGFIGTLSNTARTIYGSLTTPSTGGTYTAGTNATTFAATSGTKTLNTNGRTLDFPITFNGVGGTWQLQSNFAAGSTRTTTLTNGTLDLQSYTFTTGLFNTSNSNIRTLAFGTGNITVNGTGSVWDSGTLTNLTVTGTPVINVSNNTATAATVTPGVASEANALSFNFTTGTYTLTFMNSGGTAYAANNVNFTGFSGTWAFAGTSSSKIYGDLTLSPTMSLSSSTVGFYGTNKTQNIKSNGKSFAYSLYFAGSGSTYKLLDNLTSNAGSGIWNILNSGTIDLNGYNMTVNSFQTASSANKGITFNGGTLIITGTGSGIDFFSTTNLTFNDTGTISFNASTTKSIRGYGYDYSNVTINNGGAGELVFYDSSNTWGDLTATYTPCTFRFWYSNNLQLFKNFTLSGTSGNLVTLTSQAPGYTFKIFKSSGLVNCNYLNISYCSALGGAKWFAGKNSTNGGNNSGWIFNEPFVGNFMPFIEDAN